MVEVGARLGTGVGAESGAGVPAVSARDRLRWDAEYARRALDLACGQGGTAVWLAERGLEVRGLDVSPVAIARAADLAARHGVTGRCRFGVVDLDDGLPPGGPVDVVVCHRFRDPRLYPALIERLKPDGLILISVLSEIGGERGPYRAGPGELSAAFADLEPIAAGEGDGLAWLIGRRPKQPSAVTLGRS
jgi:2-polyprenyl-3-methyl-5-hydroxy-6-metoxy-1,4-benzoquinol methylase